jgi:hypothetical protein
MQRCRKGTRMWARVQLTWTRFVQHGNFITAESYEEARDLYDRHAATCDTCQNVEDMEVSHDQMAREHPGHAIAA